MIVRSFSIEPNPYCLQFSLQQCPLLSPFRRIENHENQITCLHLISDHLLPLIHQKPTFAAEITCRPRPFPSAAPSIIPGKSNTWISAPAYSSTPGIAVSVVNEYAATSLLVFVILERKVDLPTEGKPTRAMRASPLLETSKPEPPPEPAPGAGSRSWARRRASFLAGLMGGGGDR